MAIHCIPSLANTDVLIRLAANEFEIQQANHLIYRNYVNLYWKEDESILLTNKYLSVPSRHVAVAIESSKVIATMSAVEDSKDRLPSDSFQPKILQRFRAMGKRMAEMTSFAVESKSRQSTVLSLYLMKFFMQYTFYYLGLDRLIASCRPKHARFYQDRLCFEMYSDPLPHSYAGGVECQLVGIDLLSAHSKLSDRYGGLESSEDYYRFFYVDDDPNVHFPQNEPLRRSRETDWNAVARYREPVAVI